MNNDHYRTEGPILTLESIENPSERRMPMALSPYAEFVAQQVRKAYGNGIPEAEFLQRRSDLVAARTPSGWLPTTRAWKLWCLRLVGPGRPRHARVLVTLRRRETGGQ